MLKPLAGWWRTGAAPADLAAVVSGAALVLAFAPFEWRWFSVLSPAVLIGLWMEQPPGTAFRRGYLFGLGFFGVGVSWVFNSIYEFGQAPMLLAAAISLSFVLFLALYPALTGFVANRVFGSWRPVWLLFGVPVIWILGEWLRSWVLTGFPWLLLGQAQVDSWAQGIIPVFGTPGASLWVMLSAGLIVSVVVEPDRFRRYAFAGLLVLWGGALGLVQVQWTEPTGEPVSVSVIQGNIAQEQKWRPEALGPTLERYASLTREQFGSDLVVWPETAVPLVYPGSASEYFAPLVAEGRERGTEIVTGVFTHSSDTDAIYNSVALLGETPQVYSKRHLVPFGEFIPLRALLGWMDDLIQIPMADLGRGRGRPVLHARAATLGTSVCYEAAYSGQILEALPDAEILVNVSNDGWFGRSLAPHQHLEIARVRALEVGRYLVRATNTGISAIIDNTGRIVEQSPQFVVSVLEATVPARSGLTPYAYWGNGGLVTVLIPPFAIIAVLYARRRLRGRPKPNPEIKSSRGTSS